MLDYKKSIHFENWKGFRYFHYFKFICLGTFIHVFLKLIGFKRLTELIAYLYPNNFNKYYLKDMEDVRCLKNEINKYFKKIRKSKYLLPNCLSTSILISLILKRQGLTTYLVIGIKNNSDKFDAHAWVEYNKYPLNENFKVRKMYSTLEYNFFNF